MYSAALNALFDVLTAGKVVGQPLDYFSAVEWDAADDKVGTLAKPYMIVTIDDPAVEEDWISAKDGRGGAFRAVVVLTVGIADKTRPFGLKGDTTKRGVLTIAEEVMNHIDNNRAAILAGDPNKLVDMNLSLRGPRTIGKETREASIVVSFKPRFKAGQR